MSKSRTSFYNGEKVRLAKCRKPYFLSRTSFSLPFPYYLRSRTFLPLPKQSRFLLAAAHPVALFEAKVALGFLEVVLDVDYSIMLNCRWFNFYIVIK